jgi:hypothetical protein
VGREKSEDAWWPQEKGSGSHDWHLRPLGKSWPFSPPGPDGKLEPCGNGHPCSSALPNSMSTRMQSQWQIVGACMPPTSLMPQGLG